MSETTKHRDLFLSYCVGNGLDIGFGGDPIVPIAICFDLPNRYSFVGNSSQHIEGNAEDLSIFADNKLDYVYSSHCIEDFSDTEKVLLEWLRVVKSGGYLCLLFPDERRYRLVSDTCNVAHKHLDFGLEFVLDILRKFKGVELVASKELFEDNDYNCMVIIRKLL